MLTFTFHVDSYPPSFALSTEFKQTKNSKENSTHIIEFCLENFFSPLSHKQNNNE